jgi:nitroimidazol reductase NimA-like FMN-containing flavoprotein (pyridoxamine 5'-phosphate oxidase superfamily)
MAMRRKDRETPEEEALQLLAKGEYGVLSTVGPDGSPYGVPLSYIYREGEIYFHSAIEGRKVEYLCAGALASFCVVGATEILPEKFGTRYESAIASGEVREVEGAEKHRALGWLVEKYAPEFRTQGEEYIASAAGITRVFGLHVRNLTGKRCR